MSEYESYTSDSDSEFIEFRNKNEYIFANSRITLVQFVQVFLLLCGKLRLPRKHRDYTLKFLKGILPSDNIIPNSYRALTKAILNDNSKTKLVCSFCSAELHQNESCPNCERFRRLNPFSNPVSTVVECNIREQLKNVIELQQSTIDNYMSKNSSGLKNSFLINTYLF